MSGLKKTSKVTPIEIGPVKQNNLFSKAENIINQYKLVISVQIALGINRIYLMKHNNAGLWIGNILGVALIAITLVTMIESKSTGASNLVIQDTTCIQYILLVINAMVFKRKLFENFFANVSKFDDILNINKNISVTTSLYRPIIWMIISLIYSVTECVLLIMYVQDYADYFFAFTYVTMLANDSEQVMFGTLLRIIYLRVCVIKAHVTKAYDSKKSKDKINKLDALANNAHLDVGSLHRTYELLHQCAEQLNSLMGFPLVISLFCSGLSTTMLLKNLFKGLQMAESVPIIKKVLIIFSSVRCIKYTVLVIIPCYYSSVTTTQVTHIRTMLHDAMNGDQLDKMERRRVKAFFQLTRENEFAYALWGVIKLNMSLPLSYCSLCTTYLVIIIQFSKFID